MAGSIRAAPLLRIDTHVLPGSAPLSNKGTLYPALNQSSPSTPSPSFHVPITPNSEKISSVSVSKSQSSQNTSHAQDELSKLVALLLDQLQKRKKPPALFDCFNIHLTKPDEKGLGEVVKQKIALRGTQTPLYQHKNDSDDDIGNGAVFSTEETYELMEQLKAVLQIIVAQGLQIFSQGTTGLRIDSGSGSLNAKLSSSPFSLRSSMRRASITGKRARSSSPASRGHSQGSELLTECISTLSSIIIEDCRYQITFPRPSRPPNALQSVTLDIMQLLIHLHRGEPSITSRLTFAIIPALETFPREMWHKLLVFFQNILMREACEDLGRLRGQNEAVDSIVNQEETSIVHSTPIVSIQVDEALDDSTNIEDNPRWRPWAVLSKPNLSNIQSTNAPLQPLPVYYLSSIPLLAAVLENIDLASLTPPVLYSFFRLVNTIIESKKDAYLDLLEIVAYNTPKTRGVALAFLFTNWPASTGHPIISQPLPILSYRYKVDEENTKRHRREPLDHIYSHQFVPWKFHRSSRAAIYESVAPENCRSCSTIINGFGLFCPGCMSSVHFDCYDYPEGNTLSQYAMVSDPSIQKVAVHRFSFIPPLRRDFTKYFSKKGRHLFRFVNIFTLPVCFLCRLPIWGHQALHCVSCKYFAHITCVSEKDTPRCHSSTLDSRHITVSLPTIRHSFADYYGDIFLSSDDLGKRTYEEISVSFAILWTQLQIYNNGLVMGSIVIDTEDLDDQEEDTSGFELQHLVELYEAYLSSGKLPVSANMEEYLQENSLHPGTHTFMFDWSTLAYISSVIKSPHESQKPTFSNSSDMLGAALTDTSLERVDEDARHPFEIVALCHMRDALGYEFNLFSDAAARHCLSHLHKLGFFGSLDGRPFSIPKDVAFDQQCEFPLPLGYDLSADVETLVCAIEACLSDIDLSVNEMGFLLLNRRFWPNGLASEYALRRLSRVLLSWIFAEDDSLLAILRDYITPRKSLPGVRTSSDPFPWPSGQGVPRMHTGSANNGGDYLASRRLLRDTYVARWLFALHEQGIETYARLICQLVVDFAADQIADDGSLGTISSGLEGLADKELRLIMKLWQGSVLFSALDDIFFMWLNHLDSGILSEASIPSLPRLLNREADMSSRISRAVDSASAQTETMAGVLDPWRALIHTAKDGQKFPLTLRWVRLLARSGVSVDVSIFIEYGALARDHKASLADCLVLVEAALFSVWLRSIGYQELQSVISTVHSYLEPTILQHLQSSNKAQSLVCSFLRKSLATCLLLYGCERGHIFALELITEGEVKHLSRRKNAGHPARSGDPIIMDNTLLNIINKYVATGADDMICVIAKFLYSFTMHATLLESYEVDNFVLRNSNVLCSCVWKFYEIQHHDISSLRTSLLLRVLVVDPQPFQMLLDRQLHSGSWESRLAGLMRLFRIVLDVTSPSFHVEGRQWKSSVLDIFYYNFESMWLDEKEEIRTAVDTWCQNLLPAHLEAISACWNEALPTLPVLERLRLVSFLVQLQPHFPSWQVLSWNTIIEALLEDDYMQNNGTNDDGPAAAHLAMYGVNSQRNDGENTSVDPDLSVLRTSIMLLGLKMLSSGVDIDVVSFLKLKSHLAKLMGFSDVALVPAHHGRTFHVHFDNLTLIPDGALPCVNELPKVLDASHSFDLQPSALNSPFADDDRHCSVLVGTPLVDVSLAAFCSIDDPFEYPVLSVKALLEIVMAIVYKHDFASMALKHLDGLLRKTLRKIMDFLLLDISYESRQIALAVIQTYIKRWTAISGSLIIESIEKVVALVGLLKYNTEDTLVIQAKAFIEHMLFTLAPSGIFCSLCKHPLSPEFFTVIKSITDANAKHALQSSETLREILLQSILSQPLDVDWNINHTIATNIKSYVETVYHEGYSDSLMKSMGRAWMSNIARRSCGLNGSHGFDANVLFRISYFLLQHSKDNQDLLSCTEVIIRVSLSRTIVKKESLLDLLQITSPPRNNDHPTNFTTSTESNNISQVILEMFEDVLRLKTRVLPQTLSAIVEAILSTDIRIYSSVNRPSNMIIRNLGSSGLYFLENHIWSTTQCDMELSASMSIARFVLHAAEAGREVFEDLLAENMQRSSRSNTAVRTWNIILLAVLSDPSRKHALMVFSQLPAFLPPYYRCLGTYVQAGATLESAAADIEHAYTGLKLWLLLAQSLSEKTTGLSGNQDINPTRRIWNELWPPFETLVDIFRADSADEVLPLATTIWSSTANLFIFIHQTGSPISLDIMPQITICNRLRSFGRRDSALTKLSRILDGEFIPDTPFETVVAQATMDVANAEKLRALDRSDPQKAMPDRRRDIRIPT
ncbi:hypothetical protein BJ138DRAFT_1143394 [Hygrophoropsis aurantiaca]|uniref:Uncharacterized protein n=1 Tax=Hygrophoropsis aurantiaca TaxID=72124 RepID=A0ACB8APM9_9AGAM|nr:hypothetical protein BJ138DRAFT_1143394 [Hygrophoropsis aurantiaca]